MAVEKVSLAFGPEKGLRLQQEKYPDLDLKLLKSVTDENKFLLLDSSNQKSVFHAGLNYETRHEIGEETWQGFYEFRYFTLGTQQKDLLASIVQKWENNYQIPAGLRYSLILRDEKKNLQYLMLNVWNSELDFFDWNTADSNQINQFGYNENKKPYIAHFEPAPTKSI